MDKIYNKYNNTILTLEELEELEELQEVKEVINSGNSGYKIGYTWYIVELQDGQEINVYVK